jgi:ketosteroid isomerase-like protein
MKTLILTGLILMQSMRLDPSDEVRAAIDRFTEAFVSADTVALDGLLIDPYLHVNGSSGTLVGRDEWLAWMATQHEAIEAGDLVIDHYEVTDLTIRMRRDSANVTGVVRTNGIRDGEPFDREIRFTNVWVKEGEEWKRAMFHDSVVPAP